MKKPNPTISIITITFNAKEVLEGTIVSVIQQSYPKIEYIIVDGASSDGTLGIIEKYETKISIWISDPDRGLYDAMNKGLQLATGDFVWFMNAGDRIYKQDTVQKMVDCIEAETDIIFGEVMVVDENRNPMGTRSEITTQKLPENLNWKSLKRGMVVCHQAFLPKRKIAPNYMLDNLSADIDWVIKCLKKARKVTPTNLILAEYLQGGISKQKHQKALWDRYEILKHHYGFVPNIINHAFILMRALWHRILRVGRNTY